MFACVIFLDSAYGQTYTHVVECRKEHFVGLILASDHIKYSNELTGMAD